MNSKLWWMDFPNRLRGWQRAIPYALLLFITAALYATTLHFDFVWDDNAYVLRNYRIQGFDWIHLHAIWTHTFLGHYAPVQHSFLAFVYYFSGLNPFGYHLAQLLVHAACVLLLYQLLTKVESSRVALLATLLFVVHPTNIETVAWVSETKSTLAFFFFLLSFWFFIRMRERERLQDGVLSGLFLIISVMAKINTVVAPAIYLVYDHWQGTKLRPRRWRSLAVFFLISGLFSIIHLSAFHGTPTALESEYLGGPSTHLMNLPLLLSFYLKMIVFPYPISAWEMFPAQLHWSWIVTLGWAGFVALAGLLLRAPRRIQFWSLWIFIFLLPVLQIIPFPIWVADRYLYIPAIGGFVLISGYFFQAVDRIGRWPRRTLETAMLSATLLLAWDTYSHLPNWKNDLTLWSATTPTCMTSAYCHMNLGLALLRAGIADQGMKEMIQAVEIRPSRRTLERLGDAYTLTAHDYRQAVIAYNMALEITGPSPVSEVYGKLARAQTLAGDMKSAANVIALGKKINPNDPNLWIANGFFLWKQGNWQEARLSLRRALAMVGGNAQPAELFSEFLGQPAEVKRMLLDLRSLRAGPK